MQPAIRIENLSKQFHLGQHGLGSYRTLREVISNGVRAPWARVTRAFRSPVAHRPSDDPDSLWALKDVSFDVEPGEVVGLIGRNGAGKSTLLKILSRITEPTSGRAEIRGRIGSLLEVGTGFHHELTGRENILLNGSVLGMTRREIVRRFEEIVEFADIGRFLDTPVKRYSSGMYVRMAFAVAAHLNPEILLVDEVLAVGDQEFQRKCMGKMSEITRSHRTIILVSHNMAVIQNLCRRVAVLQRGRLGYFGPTADAIQNYVTAGSDLSSHVIDLINHPSRRRGKTAIFRTLRLFDGHGQATSQFACGGRMSLEFDVAPGEARQMHYGVCVEDSMGTRLFTVGTHLTASEVVTIGGERRLRCNLGPLMLAPGQYHLTLVAGPVYQMVEDVIDQAATFEILAANVHGNGRLPDASHGVIVACSNWVDVDDLMSRNRSATFEQMGH